MSNIPEDYPSLEIAQDALTFARSRFGVRYLQRLKKKQAKYIEIVTDDSYTDSNRNSAGSKLAVVREELDYFRTAQMIVSTPSILNKLKAKAKEAMKRV